MFSEHFQYQSRIFNSMRKWFGIWLLCGLGLSACKSEAPLSTVNEVDLERYAGTWYEIARLPISQEEGLSCVRATYTLKENGEIEVLNEGYHEADGWEDAKGVAVQPDTSKPGQLRVSFFRPFYGDYYIIELANDYSYALVGSPSRKYLWILARSTDIDSSVIETLTASADEKGFETSKFIFTKHDCEDE